MSANLAAAGISAIMRTRKGRTCGRGPRRCRVALSRGGEQRAAAGGRRVRGRQRQQAVAEQRAVLLGRQVPALDHLHLAARRRRARQGFAACMRISVCGFRLWEL